MSQRKPLNQKLATGSKNVPLKQQTAADQIAFVPPAGLPEHPELLAEDVDSQEMYYSLGSALMKYEQLFQNIDKYTLAMAAKNYKRYSSCCAVLDKEGYIIEEAKSHTAIDPDTGKMPVTKKEHPAVKIMKDAQSDFLACLKLLGLDLKGRTQIMVQMSMVKSMHGSSANTHVADKYFNIVVPLEA